VHRERPDDRAASAVSSERQVLPRTHKTSESALRSNRPASRAPAAARKHRRVARKLLRPAEEWGPRILRVEHGVRSSSRYPRRRSVPLDRLDLEESGTKITVTHTAEESAAPSTRASRDEPKIQPHAADARAGMSFRRGPIGLGRWAMPTEEDRRGRVCRENKPAAGCERPRVRPRNATLGDFPARENAVTQTPSGAFLGEPQSRAERYRRSRHPVGSPR